MISKEFGFSLRKKGQTIETVRQKGLDVGLLASYGGTEVIHHKLYEDHKWAMGPTDEWNSLEFIYVLSGKMKFIYGNEEILLSAGDHFHCEPVKEDIFLQAINDSEFIYVCGQPIFHYYSHNIQSMKDLAISVEEKDGYTSDHCQRIMELSMMLGKKLGLASKDLYTLNLGSFLHDVGKIRVPDHVLNKPDKLTPEEWELMKKHTIYGVEILEDTNIGYLKDAAKIVGQHHERYDGSGYPFGLKGDEIYIGAKIVAVVDSYDAMTTDRVYRKGMAKEDALEELQKGIGSLYDPDVAKAFLELADQL
ncbi:HD domain-containing phosphohydrolase [Mesobacillus foraminis]|uniref:Putative nucleotidyltransferase with HDIG domain n=1 Tax=Mesobacillus foraminis TaxID=279826 RepID=A0A4R2BDT2_9BACI|nr:HD domain-containing phosphohydrolase [Mesobacillus foraminis]TCN25087.1 putative nucleotidyltransferase with HDIG domain [Mesobacillus foraminis]